MMFDIESTSMVERFKTILKMHKVAMLFIPQYLSIESIEPFFSLVLLTPYFQHYWETLDTK